MAITVSTYNHTAKKLLDLSMTDEAANFYFELLDTNASFTATDTAKTTVDSAGTYEVDGNGWTTGGENLANVDATTVTTNDAMIDADDISVTATGGTIGDATAGLIYVNEGDADTTYTPLWYVDFDGTKSASTGNDFQVNFHADGIAQVTVT